MRDISLGQYYPANSVVHRLDARFKIIAAIVYMVMVFFCYSFVSYAAVILAVILIIFLTKVPPLKVLRSLKMIIYLLIFTTVLTLIFYEDHSELPLAQWWVFKIYKEGLLVSARLILRLTLLVVGPALLTFTTTPVELTDAIESLLKPLKAIKFPVHELTIIMSIALRLVPSLVEETDKIISAQKARGAKFESKNIFKKARAMLPVLIPLFVSSFRRADELADAMDSRCYRGAKGRTRMKVFKVRLADFAALFLLFIVFFVVLMLKYNWFGFAGIL